MIASTVLSSLDSAKISSRIYPTHGGLGMGGDLVFTIAPWQVLEASQDFAYTANTIHPLVSVEELKTKHAIFAAKIEKTTQQLKTWVAEPEFQGDWDNLLLEQRKELLVFSLETYAYLRQKLSYGSVHDLSCGLDGKRYKRSAGLYRTLSDTKSTEKEIFAVLGAHTERLGLGKYSKSSQAIEKLNNYISQKFPVLTYDNLKPTDYIWLLELDKLSIANTEQNYQKLEYIKDTIQMTPQEISNLCQALVQSKLIPGYMHTPGFPEISQWQKYIETTEVAYQEKWAPILEQKKLQKELTPQHEVLENYINKIHKI